MKDIYNKYSDMIGPELFRGVLIGMGIIFSPIFLFVFVAESISTVRKRYNKKVTQRIDL